MNTLLGPPTHEILILGGRKTGLCKTYMVGYDLVWPLYGFRKTWSRNLVAPLGNTIFAPKTR